MPAESPALVHVEVAYSAGPGHMELVPLALRTGACLSDALTASGLLARHGLRPGELRAGIWGKARELDAPLRESDRVEIYRPLLVDPKEARRQRYRRDKPGRKRVAA